jgi:hypothetical protein
MVDTRDSKSRAAKRGGSSPLQGRTPKFYHILTINKKKNLLKIEYKNSINSLNDEIF